MAEEAMVHPRASKRRVRLAYGGRARSLRRALRPEVSDGLLRRDALPDGGRNAHPHTCKAGASGALRLRIRTQGDGQHLRFLRAEGQSWRHLDITERRTTVDFAQAMRRLAEEHYPEAEKVRVVLDNLNTHTAASLYKAFEPEEARRVLRHLEFHHTPKHASWLDEVEIELSALLRQCLSRRSPDESTLKKESAEHGSTSETNRRRRFRGASPLQTLGRS
jgi:DDE superfamily endonuclease